MCVQKICYSVLVLVVVFAVTCPAILTPLHASYTYTRGNETNVVGASVEFSCSSGYHLVGFPYLRCQAAETWSDDIPQCEPGDAPLPTYPNPLLVGVALHFIDMHGYICSNEGYVHLLLVPSFFVCYCDCWCSARHKVACNIDLSVQQPP